MECIVCQEPSTAEKKLVMSPSAESLEKLLERARERAKYKDPPVFKVKDTSRNELPRPYKYICLALFEP